MTSMFLKCWGFMLVAVQEKVKVKLSAEEARKQAEELVRKAKEKREVWSDF
jgi:polyhydroxyalkanoate synthesis regulator phasin